MSNIWQPTWICLRTPAQDKTTDSPCFLIFRWERIRQIIDSANQGFPGWAIFFQTYTLWLCQNSY